MKKRLLAPVLVLLCMLVLTACLGPNPVLKQKIVTPPGPDSPGLYHVEAIISNAGPGDGQIDVVARLIDKRNGSTLTEDDKQVNLDIDETTHVLFDLQIPPSESALNPDDIEVEVKPHYPD